MKKINLKTPFVISFKKKFQSRNKSDVFDLFLTNISETYHKKVERENESKLVVKGAFFHVKRLSEGPFLYNLILPSWVRFCRKAELYFAKNNTIVYSVDYTYGAIWLMIILAVSILPVWLTSLYINMYYYMGFVAVIFALGIFSMGLQLYFHRQVFLKTLKNENLFKGNYDWDKILKSKTDNELKNMASGNTSLTVEVQKMAQEELTKRKTAATPTPSIRPPVDKKSFNNNKHQS